jgi:hypothetical protein
MKFKVKSNVLPKHIKQLQRYLNNESSDESSYDSEESSYESYDSDDSNEYTTSSGSSESGSEYTEESYETSKSETDFKEFLKEYAKIRNYRIKEDPLVIKYKFDSNKVKGKWKRHTDKSIEISYKFLNMDKESVKKGILFHKLNRL